MTDRCSIAIDHTLVIAGLTIQARVISGREPSEKLPWLVFLHDGLGCIHTWRDFPSAVSSETGLSALIYDRQGYGGSRPLTGGRRPDYMHVEALEILPRILDAFTIRKVFLIGHSDGGTIALLFASSYPERTAGVITEAAHVFVEDMTLEGIQKAVKDYESGYLKEKLQHLHGKNTEGAFRGWSNIWLSPLFRDWSITGILPRITAPLLLIQGAEDEYGTPSQVEAIREGVSGPIETHLIPGCGHTPHHQSRETVLCFITEFIRRLSSSQSVNPCR